MGELPERRIHLKEGETMASYKAGKAEAVAWIKEHFKKGSTCLDVGCCDGKWSKLLNDYLIMDGVEVWQPYIVRYDLKNKYHRLFESDIRNLEYGFYDLIIFGDIIEHLPVDDARRVLEYAKTHCKNMIVAVPFLHHQDAKNFNPYEIHIQDDLTPEIFDERFSGFVAIYQNEKYAYYVRGDEE